MRLIIEKVIFSLIELKIFLADVKDVALKAFRKISLFL